MIDERDSLDAWIAELRGRVARSELVQVGLVDVGQQRLPGALAARIMLADIDHLDGLLAAQTEDPSVPQRRALLLVDFNQLRAQIG
jgi:hypothetical protein